MDIAYIFIVSGEKVVHNKHLNLDFLIEKFSVELNKKCIL